jgi:Flp pilus assembly protein TadG
MMALPRLFSRLRSDRRGAVLIETAIVGPVLILMSLGAFEIGSMVARNNELVSAVAEAQSMVLAVDIDTQEKRDQLKDLIADSTGLSPENVTVEEAFRCNSAQTYVATMSDCATGDRVSSLIRIEVVDTYEPLWTKFGVSGPLEYRVDRHIIYKQATKA